MTDDRPKPPLHRAALPNGLRILLAPDPRTPRVSVAVHYRVGFRSEPPGREGFAHLFEHLMFRGSASLPDGRFYDHVHRWGGAANGTTHQDYTDYYQAVPAAALEQALFSEADRMRSPRFTARALAEQLSGVELEARQATIERPYGGFPWPLLAGALYTTHPNAHDGFGDMRRLRRATLDDCADFFTAHYAPGNAVLTVAGDHDPRQAMELITRHFGDIPSRPLPPRTDLTEPLRPDDHRVSWTEPGIDASAVAVGLRLPDPEEDLPGYLSHLVLTDLLGRYGTGMPEFPAVSTSCGFFGPLDARSPDTLVLTAVLPAERSQHLLEVVRNRWSYWAASGADDRFIDAVRRSVRVLAAEHHRRHDDLQIRCRSLGRLEALFDRAELVDRLPDLITAVTPEQVAAAARSLRTAPATVLTIAPGSERTRPLAGARDGRRDHIAHDRLRARPTTAAPGPLPVPAAGAHRDPSPSEQHDTTLPNGLRTVAVRHDRTPLVELRLRLPVGPLGWAHSAQVDHLTRLIDLRGQAALNARAPVGQLRFSTDGQWLDATGYTSSTGLDGWLDALAETLTAALPTVDPRDTATGFADADRLLDDTLRAHVLPAPAAGRPGIDGRGLLERLGRSLLDPTGAVLVAIGELDPRRFAPAAQRALASWSATATERLTDQWFIGASVAPTGGRAPGDLLLREPAAGAVAHLKLSVPEAPSGVDEAARFLATAVLGGYHRSRLASRTVGTVLDGCAVFAGRDTFLDRPRAYVRATVPKRLASPALAALREEMRGMAERPPSAAEVDPAREFCAGQLLSVFDSAAVRADQLCRTVAAGRSPSLLERLPARLREVPVRDVAAAAAALFAHAEPTCVMLGDVEPGVASDDSPLTKETTFGVRK
ncbi:M16 family metallopeptidase [Kitasatospora sp. NPDC059827]|uniref:M16 family metallopeptidase n=1 Tax=Kitasatospora sp. NPDC059827 TaxID=3346964 RepID=UPI003665E369